MSKEEIISELMEEMPYRLNEKLLPYIKEAMDLYAKEVALKFYEFEESVPPENMAKHFDYFIEKFKFDYGI